MSLRTEYVRNFYADHQTNFGQPDDADPADVRAAALREFDEWLQNVRADVWDEAIGEVAADQPWDVADGYPNPYASETE